MSPILGASLSPSYQLFPNPCCCCRSFISGRMTSSFFCRFRAALFQYFVVAVVLMSAPISVSGGSVSHRLLSSDAESRGGDSITSLTSRRDVPRGCAPVPHDTLWLRLNLEPQQAPSSYEDHDVDDEDGDYTVAQAPTSLQKTTSGHTNSRRKLSPSTRHRRSIELFDGYPSRDSILEQSSTVNDDGHIDEALLSDSTEQLPTHNSTGHRMRHPFRRSRRNVTRRKQKHDEDADIKSDVEPIAGSEPWHCHMEPHWQRQPEGTFPPFLQTGRCRQKRCMLGYECRPRKYAARVLRRVPGRCNPLPLVGDGTSSLFEEAWVVEEVRVTVGCECTRRRAVGVYGVLTGGSPR